jgi:hypothetical protein
MNVPRVVWRLQLFAILTIGGGSLALFIWFAAAGPIFPPRELPVAQRLAWDAALSFLFFAQHSGMIRQGVRRRLGALVPEHAYGAIYTIASGLALAAVVVLWQPAGEPLLHAGGMWRLAARLVALLALALFAWAALSLDSFDPFGTLAMAAHRHDRHRPPPALVARGPYRYIRHPFYAASILLIWSNPDLTSDRLLFNLLWTGWIVLGALLEERDLGRELGAAYGGYRRAVPMLLPRPRLGMFHFNRPHRGSA